MADYSKQLIKAETGKCLRTETAINLGKATVLYDVFQRVGALDIHFGLQSDLGKNEYPFKGPKQAPMRGVTQTGSSLIIDSAGTSERHLDANGGSETTKQSFLVDEIYKDLLQKGPSDDFYVTGCSMNEETGMSNCARQSGLNMNHGPSMLSNAHQSRESYRLQPSGSVAELTGAVDQRKPSNIGSSQGLNGAHGTMSNTRRKSDSSDTETVYLQKCNSESRNDDNSEYMVADTQKMGTYDVTSNRTGSYNRQPGKPASKESTDVSNTHSRKINEPVIEGPLNVGCNLLSHCQSAEVTSVPCVLPPSVTNTAKRLHVNIWFQKWFLPNFSAAVKSISKMAVEVGDGVRRYFTPLQLEQPARKFDEVYLSSLEYAILKDDLTRCYFHIDNDYKEHLMLREVDDYRRLYMRRRITFNDFCHHFHIYLARNKEDYARNKETEFDEEPLQNRAIQQVLEKSIYGLCIEQPNEFFKKNCALKPYHMLEPIPQK